VDSLSHAVFGIAIASMSGQPFSINDPIYLASLLGSQAPDFDIIALLRGNFAFIRQHRAFSHSIPGIIACSTLIAGSLNFFIPSASFYTLFCWALAGAFSHILIDYFNTHGTAILWPVRKERKSLHLLNVFDPILLGVLLSLYLLNMSPLTLGVVTFATLTVYIAIRCYLRYKAKHQLLIHFKDYQIVRLAIMPSLKKVFAWDFILETSDFHYIGQIKSYKGEIEFWLNLPRQNKSSEITEKAKQTLIGKFFCTFTPFAYYEEEYDISSLRINIYDLRYYLNHQFIHRATIIFNEDRPADVYLYSEGKMIKIPC
jgi:inner membrane protein